MADSQHLAGDCTRVATPCPHKYIAIVTDGMGTYQARCLGCQLRGPWRRKEGRAVADAKRLNFLPH
jgi:hypothetical protein